MRHGAATGKPGNTVESIMKTIKQRQVLTFKTLDNGDGEPVRVVRVEGDRVIVKFLTGYVGMASVSRESLS